MPILILQYLSLSNRQKNNVHWTQKKSICSLKWFLNWSAIMMKKRLKNVWILSSEIYWKYSLCNSNKYSFESIYLEMKFISSILLWVGVAIATSIYLIVVLGFDDTLKLFSAFARKLCVSVTGLRPNCLF